MLRVALLTGVAFGVSACANEPSITHVGFAPMMMVAGPAAAHRIEPSSASSPSLTGAGQVAVTATEADPSRRTALLGASAYDISKKSMAAKVLAARALENVTGIKPDPARFSEHD